VLFGLNDRATFAVASIEDTGLPAGSADGVICIDAFQFGTSGRAVADEIRRVLRPRGRVAVTCWEPADPGDEELPEPLRDLDLARDLGAAGLADVEVVDRPAWREIERGLWEEAAALDPGDDPALVSTRNEAENVLAHFDQMRRVLATATAP
jgi:SAM-dependent methyltransferase